MGLFTTTDDKQLEEARKQVVAAEMVCPACKQSFDATGQTLSAFNGALGLEGHTCPHCGHVISRRKPSPDGL
jgi:rRNA maturation endonuclease Nob1